jgi:hypothetical protein
MFLNSVVNFKSVVNFCFQRVHAQHARRANLPDWSIRRPLVANGSDKIFSALLYETDDLCRTAGLCETPSLRRRPNPARRRFGPSMTFRKQDK